MTCAAGWLERLRQTRRRYGAVAVVQYALDCLARRIGALDIHHLLWLEAEGMKPAALEDGRFVFRFLGPSEVATFAADPENCLDATLADELASGGHYCFAALADGRLAAYGWYALGSVDPKHCGDVGLALPADVAYFYNGFTRPEFRGRRVIAALIAQGLRALADRGIRCLVTNVGWTKWAALRSSRRLGFVDLGYAVSIGRGRCRLLFSPRAAKRLGIGFGKRG
jgi:GNAT superfamily N-acetyltransferase